MIYKRSKWGLTEEQRLVRIGLASGSELMVKFNPEEYAPTVSKLSGRTEMNHARFELGGRSEEFVWIKLSEVEYFSFIDPEDIV